MDLHHLIILDHTRLALHHQYATRHERLDDAVDHLTSGRFARVDKTAVAETVRVHQKHPQPATGPGFWQADHVLNQVAKRCRDWDVHVLLDTTQTPEQVTPQRLYTVHTAYLDRRDAIAEHFTSPLERHQHLVERAAQFVTRPDQIPTDPHRLADVVGCFVQAQVTLTDAIWDPATGTYRPTEAVFITACGASTLQAGVR